MKDAKSLKIIFSLIFVLSILIFLDWNRDDHGLGRSLAFGHIFWLAWQSSCQDVVTCLSTFSRVGPEWLAGVLFYPFYSALGELGLQLLRYLFVFIILSLIYKAGRERGNPPVYAALGLLIVLLVLVFNFRNLNLRVLTYLFFATTLYILEKYRHSQETYLLSLLLPVQILWCNFDSGFPAGLVLQGCYALGETINRRFSRWLWLTCILCLMIALIILNLEKYPDLRKTISLPSLDLYLFSARYQFTYNSIIFFVINLSSLPWLLRWQRWQDWSATLALPVFIGLGWWHMHYQIFLSLLLGAYSPALLQVYRRNPFVARAIAWGRQVPKTMIEIIGIATAATLFLYFLSLHPFQAFSPQPPGHNEKPAERIHLTDPTAHIIKTG